MSCAITAQQGAGIQLVRLPHQPVGDFLRIERGVGFADGVDHGVPVLDART